MVNNGVEWMNNVVYWCASRDFIVQPEYDIKQKMVDEYMKQLAKSLGKFVERTATRDCIKTWKPL